MFVVFYGISLKPYNCGSGYNSTLGTLHRSMDSTKDKFGVHSSLHWVWVVLSLQIFSCVQIFLGNPFWILTCLPLQQNPRYASDRSNDQYHTSYRTYHIKVARESAFSVVCRSGSHCGEVNRGQSVPRLDSVTRRLAVSQRVSIFKDNADLYHVELDYIYVYRG